jgi:hypothetical protein
MNKADALADFLEDKGVRLHRGRMGWQKVSCPGAGHARGDRDPSMTVNLTTGYCRCWSCDYTDGRAVDVIHLIQRDNNLDYKTALSTLGIEDTPSAEEQELWL